MGNVFLFLLEGRQVKRYQGATPVQHRVQVPELKQVEGASKICGTVLGAGVRSDASGSGNEVSESPNNSG